MKITRNLWLVCCMFITVLLFVGISCAPTAPTPPTSKEPVKLGFIGPLTGYAIDDGRLMAANFQLAIDVQNEKGGILNGRQVVGITYDEQALSSEAAKGATKLITQDKVKAVLGTWESASGVAVKDICKSYNIPFVCSTSGSTLVTSEGYPGVVANSANVYVTECLGMIYWFEKNKVSDVSILAEDVPYSYQIIEFLNERWGVAGSPIKINDVIFHPQGKSDLSVEVTKLVSTNPGAVICLDYTVPAMSAAAQQLKILGYNGFKYGVHIGRPAILPAFGDSLEGFWSGNDWMEDPTVPANVAYAKLSREKIPDPAVANDIYMPGAWTYDGTNICMLAFDKAGTDSDTLKWWQAVQTLDYTTAYGNKLQVLPNGRVPHANGYIVQIKDGKVNIIDRYPVSPSDYK